MLLQHERSCFDYLIAYHGPFPPSQCCLAQKRMFSQPLPLQFAESDHRAVRDILDLDIVDLNEYGIDDNGPTPPLQTNNHVVVPRSLVELSEDQETFLDSRVQPLADDENYGIGLYRRTVILVEEFQQELD